MKKKAPTIDRTPEILKALEQFKEGDRVFNKLTKQHGYFHSPNHANAIPECWCRYEYTIEDELRLSIETPTNPLDLELCTASSACLAALPDYANERSHTQDLQTNSKLANSSSLPNTLEKFSPDTIPTSPVTTMLEPLIQNEEALTELLPDSPVKTSPMPENEQELQERDQDFSLKSSDSFAWYDRTSSSWKTYQACLLTGWEPYSQSFPKSGTMRNGQLFLAPRWVESTEESEFSLLQPHKEIVLSNGQIALVSEQDYVLVSRWKWKGHNGYAARTAKSKKEGVKWETILMHRLIMQPSELEEIDHINRNKLDNRRENLRIVPHYVNTHNKPSVGAHLPKGRNKWKAQIYVNKKRIYLGCYNTEAEATLAYENAKKEYGLMTTQATQSIYLPTPKAQDGEHPGVVAHKKGQTLHLSAAVQNLPTPTARDWKDGSKNQVERDRSENLNDRMAAMTGNKKLSVNFVEKMMGFPPNWTALETISCDTPTSPNGLNEPPIQIPSSIEKNDSKLSETALLQIAPRSLGEELLALPLKETDQWGTPDTEAQPILTLVKQLLGGEIGLDPTSNDERRTGAIAHFTQARTCLDKDWTSSGVFMNPPFSKPLPFVEKLCTEYAAGHFPQAIALLKLGCVSNKGTGALINRYASAICLWRAPRIRFTSGGVQSTTSPDFDCVLVYFGQNQALFDELFSPYGTVTKLVNNEVAIATPSELTGEVAIATPSELMDEVAIATPSELMDEVEALGIIEEINNSCNKIRSLLVELDSRRGYLALGFSSMNQLLKSNLFGKAKSTLRLELVAGKIEKENLNVPIGTFNESQLRSLPKLKSDYHEEAITLAKDIAGDRPLTANDVSAAVSQIAIDRPETRKKSIVDSIKEKTFVPLPERSEYQVGDVVIVKPKGSTLRYCDGYWGILERIGENFYHVCISVKNEVIQCKGDELKRVETNEQDRADFKSVSDRIFELAMLMELDPIDRAQLEVLQTRTAWTQRQLRALAYLEELYGISQ